MPRPILAALLAFTAVPSLCLGGDPEGRKLSSTERKAQEQAGKLGELLGSLGVSEAPAEQAGERYEAFRLKVEADQQKEIDRLVETFDFASGAGQHRDARAHFAGRGIVPGAGGHATRDSIGDAKREFAQARKDNPARYEQLITDPGAQDQVLKRHGVQPPDVEAARPVVFGDERCLAARRAELKLKPLMKKEGLPPEHAVWVLREVKGLADLLEKGKDAQAAEGNQDDKEDDEGDRPRRRGRR